MYLAVVVHESNRHLIDAEQRLAAIEDLLEHRLSIGHRAADRPQHLGEGREQRDLLDGKRFRRLAQQGDRANALPVT